MTRDTGPDIALEKDRVRRRCLGLREEMSAAALTAASAAIASRVAAMDAWESSRTVHSYVDSMAGEVQTRALIDLALSQGKRVVVPVVSGQRQPPLLHAQISSFGDLVVGPMGLRQPPLERAGFDDLGGLDLVVVPGLAFARTGGRLGLGGGYYDRFLANVAATKVGVVCEELLLAALPITSHDIPMDWVVTERAAYPRRPERRR